MGGGVVWGCVLAYCCVGVVGIWRLLLMCGCGGDLEAVSNVGPTLTHLYTGGRCTTTCAIVNQHNLLKAVT